MQNETFRRLLDSVKLINFIDNLMAEHEIGFAEGKKEGFVQGKIEGFAEGKSEGRVEGHKDGLEKGHNDAVSVLQDMGLSSEQVAEFKAKLEARNAE